MQLRNVIFRRIVRRCSNQIPWRTEFTIPLPADADRQRTSPSAGRSATARSRPSCSCRCWSCTRGFLARVERLDRVQLRLEFILSSWHHAADGSKRGGVSSEPLDAADDPDVVAGAMIGEIAAICSAM
jgi:hypothetical protein